MHITKRDAGASLKHQLLKSEGRELASKTRRDSRWLIVSFLGLAGTCFLSTLLLQCLKIRTHDGCGRYLHLSLFRQNSSSIGMLHLPGTILGDCLCCRCEEALMVSPGIASGSLGCEAAGGDGGGEPPACSVATISFQCQFSPPRL